MRGPCGYQEMTDVTEMIKFVAFQALHVDCHDYGIRMWSAKKLYNMV